MIREGTWNHCPSSPDAAWRRLIVQYPEVDPVASVLGWIVNKCRPSPIRRQRLVHQQVPARTKCGVPARSATVLLTENQVTASWVRNSSRERRPPKRLRLTGTV